MYLPKGFSNSSLKQRKEFYKKLNIKKIKEWVKFRKGKNVYSFIVAKGTNIYLKKYENIRHDMMLIDDYENLKEVKEYLIDYLPESVYYDRNLYKDLSEFKKSPEKYKSAWKNKNFLGQELAIDLDPENITCPKCGGFIKRMRKKQGLSFCEECFKLVKQETYRLYKFLNKRFNKLRLIYSGRGFHIHVLDKNVFEWNKTKRIKFSRLLNKNKFKHDSWVTTGESRFIRLPYSLNGIVNKMALPLKIRELLKFDPRKKQF